MSDPRTSLTRLPVHLDDYTLRRLRPADWPVMRRLRLAALTQAHGLLGGDLATERSRGAADWMAEIAGPGRAVWAVWRGGQPVGMTAVEPDWDDPAALWFRASYLDPAHRGKGLMRRFYDARIDWALGMPGLERALISHRDGNVPAERAIRRAGFRHIETVRSDWADGAVALEHCYVLDLRAMRRPGAARGVAA